MNPVETLCRWLDIRPGELRLVTLSFLGAFCVISFLILGRALREALYLTRFDVTTLPYITAAVAVLGLPTVAAFSAVLGRRTPEVVFRSLVVILSAGLLVLWPLVAGSRLAVLVFYGWTALGTLLLTSSFWVVMSEHFALREAKRLFGIVSGGGTVGAMITGTSLQWLTLRVDTPGLVVGLVLLLALLFGVQLLMPDRRVEGAEDEADEGRVSMLRGLRTVWDSRHMRNVALIVFTATMASTMLDYQFKEMVRESIDTSEGLAGFFGTFYGWTGVIGLLIQLLLASGLMATAGVTVTLAILPTLLILGSAGFLVAPGLALVTVVRGADNSLRKSLHRMVLEYLFVPVRASLRRRTKTFIDSVVDSIAEGCGAAVVFLWVTFGGMDSRYLSVPVIVVAAVFIFLAVRMGDEYMATLRERLRESGGSLDDRLVETHFDGRDLLTVTMTQFDLRRQLEQAGIAVGSGRRDDDEEDPDRPITPRDRLGSSDPMEVQRALAEGDDWGEDDVDDLIRLIPQSVFYERVTEILREIGEPADRRLIEILDSEDADFVIRRRVPKILTTSDSPEAHAALLRALSAGRFEVRYRAAIALIRRRRLDLPEADVDADEIVWSAIAKEVSRDRPIWELQKLLDGAEAGSDDFVERRVGVRGELSLEHTFRLLALVLDTDLVRTAFHGIVLDDEHLKSISLEYLEQVLPGGVRRKLWPFIGDVSDYQREKALRPVDEVASDLLKTGATLFGDESEQAALRAAIDSHGERGRRDDGEG